jgi:nucleoid-associated protein YgaU
MAHLSSAPEGVNNLELNLKSILKTIKLNESNLSMLLGALVIIVVGFLLVNYFRDRGTGLTLPGISTSVNEEEPTATPGEKTYTVVSGDNLWNIAEKYYGSGYNWTDIAKANSLVNPGVISVGHKLAMPEVSVKSPTTAQASPSETVKTDAISGATYTVVKGDNLWNIAVRAYGDGYQWTKIAQENKLVNPSLIHSGNVLTIPR